MFKGIKTSIARFILLKKLKRKNDYTISFKNFLIKSESVLVVMPVSDTDMIFTFDILQHLVNRGKKISVYIDEARKNKAHDLNRYEVLTFGENDLNSYNMPAKDFTEKLKSAKYDIVIDLNRDENLLMCAVTNYVDARYRIGFEKENADEYYNMQVPKSKNNAEISYRNLLNSLKMF